VVCSEWFWYYLHTQNPWDVQFMQANYWPGFTYQDFGPQFRAELFDPTKWAALFGAAGARYVVLTSKHHEGFTNWPSNVSFSWNAPSLGPARDLVGELVAAVRKQGGIHMGLYHSLLEWWHLLYMIDQANNWSTQLFPFRKPLPEMVEIVNRYKPDILWSDGDWQVLCFAMLYCYALLLFSSQLPLSSLLSPLSSILNRPPPSTGTRPSSSPGSTTRVPSRTLSVSTIAGERRRAASTAASGTATISFRLVRVLLSLS